MGIDPLSISASIIALLQATSVVLQFLYNVKNAGRERCTFAQEIHRLSLLLQQLEIRLRDAPAGDPWFQVCLSLAAPEGTLTQLARVVDELKLKLTPETGFNKLGQKLTWTFTKTDCDRILAQIERLKSHITIVLNQDQFQICQEIWKIGKETNKGVQAIQDAKDLDDIVAWLSPLEFPAQQQKIYSEATAATGQWLLESEDFQTWVMGRAATLYCPASPAQAR